MEGGAISARGLLLSAQRRVLSLLSVSNSEIVYDPDNDDEEYEEESEFLIEEILEEDR